MRREGELRVAWESSHSKLIGTGLSGVCYSRHHFRHQ